MEVGMKHTQGEVDGRKNVSSIDIWEIPGPNCIARIFDLPDSTIRDGNATRFVTLWNAANGMTTEEAVRYLKHGREMESFIRNAYMSFDATIREKADDLLTAMKEGE
jgi:hypothetical protein